MKVQSSPSPTCGEKLVAHCPNLASFCKEDAPELGYWGLRAVSGLTGTTCVAMMTARFLMEGWNLAISSVSSSDFENSIQAMKYTGLICVGAIGTAVVSSSLHWVGARLFQGAEKASQVATKTLQKGGLVWDTFRAPFWYVPCCGLGCNFSNAD